MCMRGKDLQLGFRTDPKSGDCTGYKPQTPHFSYILEIVERHNFVLSNKKKEQDCSCSSY